MKRLAGLLLPDPIRKRVKTWALSKAPFCSQAGQDHWVMTEVFDGKRGGYFVDLGAYDGLTISNTYLLESALGWDGLCIEANPNAFKKLARNRRVTCLCRCIDGTEGEVDFALRRTHSGIAANGTDNENTNCKTTRLRTTTLEQSLREVGAPTEIDYLSVDVEGAEERVLGAFPFDRYTFRAITIERPSPTLMETLESNSYSLVRSIPGLDCFYIHASHITEYLLNITRHYERRAAWTPWPFRYLV